MTFCVCRNTRRLPYLSSVLTAATSAVWARRTFAMSFARRSDAPDPPQPVRASRIKPAITQSAISEKRRITARDLVPLRPAAARRTATRPPRRTAQRRGRPLSVGALGEGLERDGSYLAGPVLQIRAEGRRPPFGPVHLQRYCLPVQDG